MREGELRSGSRSRGLLEQLVRKTERLRHRQESRKQKQLKKRDGAPARQREMGHKRQAVKQFGQQGRRNLERKKPRAIRCAAKNNRLPSIGVVQSAADVTTEKRRWDEKRSAIASEFAVCLSSRL